MVIMDGGGGGGGWGLEGGGGGWGLEGGGGGLEGGYECSVGWM